MFRTLLSLALILAISSSSWAEDETPQEFFFAFDTGYITGHNLNPEGREPLVHFAAANDRNCLAHLLKQLVTFVRKPDAKKKVDRLFMLGGRFESEVKVGIRLICAGAKPAPKNLIQVAQKSKKPSPEELTCAHFVLEPVVIMRNEDGIEGITRLYQIENSGGLIRITNKQSKTVLTTDFKDLSDLDPIGKQYCTNDLNEQDMNFVMDEATNELSTRIPTPRPEPKPEKQDPLLHPMIRTGPKVLSI